MAVQEIEREREIERVKGAKSNNSLCNAGMPNGSRMMGEARKLRMLLTSVQQVKSFVGASESNQLYPVFHLLVGLDCICFPLYIVRTCMGSS